MKVSEEKLEKIYCILERAHLYSIPPKESFDKIKNLLDEENGK